MSKYVDLIEHDDCPHLCPPFVSAEERADILAALAPHEREAREKGIPSIGSGAVYPVRDEDVLVDPFPIPSFWGQAYGLDVGWNMTAAIFAAHDPEKDIFYVTGEYYEAKKEPVIHAHSLKEMMLYPVQGAIDPAAAGANQRDGRCLLDEYRELGLDLANAANAVEAGLHRCLRLMQTARLKVFRTCTNWLKEKRLYRRDDKGKIVKEKDHLMDAMRYVIFTDGIYEAAPEPEDARQESWGEF